MTAIFAIVKRLLASNKISFIITALVVLCATSSGDVVLSNGNYTWLLAVLTPFFFVFYDFTKLMHLGASKKDYFFGCLISYGFLAFCISLVNTVIHLLIDPIYPAQTVINMMDVCQMDGKRDDRCRIAANVLFAACYGFSSCAVIHADALVWVADRRGASCNYLHFYADCTIAR